VTVTQELETRPVTAMQEPGPAELSRDVLAMIARASADPQVDVAKMQQLLDMQMQVMAMRAEASFNQALADIKARLPRITKNGAILLGGGKTIAFARYEDIDAAVRPLMTKFGFTVTYTSELVGTGNTICVTGKFRHVDGHHDSGSVYLPLTDDSGAKNKVQGAGSSLSYGKRYVLCQYLDIVTEGDDDDGMQGLMKPLSDKHRSEIIDLIADSKCDEAVFLEYMEVKSVDAIVERDFLKAKTALIAKRDRKKKP
jgi:hypothetical protein